MTTGLPNFDSVEKPEIGKISLSQFLTYENPNISHYQELIKREHFVSMGQRLDAPFSDSWSGIFFNRGADTERFQPEARYEEAFQYLLNKLKGEVLIDLGGSMNPVIPSLAKKCGASRCIDVDVMSEEEVIGPNFDPSIGYKKDPNGYGFLTQQEEKGGSMEWIVVRADILNFVARLPNGSVNFSINGIDSNVINTKEYSEALEAEIKRATKAGGIVFGVGSVVLPTGDGWNRISVEAPGKIIEKVI